MVCIPLGKVVSLTRVARSLRLEKRPCRRGLCLLQAFKRAGIPRAAQLRGRRADVPDLQLPIGLNFQVPIVLLSSNSFASPLFLPKRPCAGSECPCTRYGRYAAWYWQRATQVGVYGATVG